MYMYHAFSNDDQNDTSLKPARIIFHHEDHIPSNNKSLVMQQLGIPVFRLTLAACSKNWSSSVFFATSSRVKYESSVTGIVTLDTSIDMEVAITYAWLTRLIGTPFTEYGPAATASVRWTIDEPYV